MLIRASVDNFRSFKSRQELTLVATSLKDLPGALMKLQGLSHKLLRTASIYGANASGKTNVLKALSFICSAVSDSHQKWAPEGRIDRQSFRLDESESKPSSFELDFLVNRTRYRYGFTLTSEKILREWLYAYPQGKPQLWFSRDEEQKESPNRFSFGRHLSGENRAIEALTRKNSLFLSAAAQNNHEMLLPIYNWFATGVHFAMSPRSYFARDFSAEISKDDLGTKFLAQMLTNADFGLTGIRVERTDLLEKDALDDDTKKTLLNFIASVKKMVPKFDSIVTNIFLLHRGSGPDPVEFPIAEESAGTVAYFSLLGLVFTALLTGGVLCVDELDASLHPLLALEIVRLFNDEKRNPNGAQLIFNTHDTNLLDNTVLRRDQIWFTEKDDQGATHLYPLSDFAPRKNENVKRGYLQGRFGAIPFLGEFALEMKEVDDKQTRNGTEIS
jgi:uncharacterized protein